MDVVNRSPSMLYSCRTMRISTDIMTCRIFPQILYYITIPAYRNAPLLPAPTTDKRWPVMFFSHGLAGSRNMYSHICGSLSSHGLVVIAMDHRDGSSPIQYVRATKDTESQTIEPITLSHKPSPEVYEGRDKQLRIRMWELGLAHTAILDMDKGQKLENLDQNTSKSHKVRSDVLNMFKDALQVHESGKISWSGHSFGAVTTVQFVKSVFYASERPAKASNPLFAPGAGSAITKQITAKSPIALLDLWGLPLASPAQSWIKERPLPAYTAGGLGGKSIVSVLSEGFFNWTGNLQDVKRAVAPPKGYSGPQPHVFYPTQSQHFSQSDFGILFPWLTKRFLKAEEPERILKLNMRAVLQMLRQSGTEVAKTSAEDMELSQEKAGEQDLAILDPNAGIRAWTAISIDARAGLNGASVKSSTTNDEKAPADDPQSGHRMEL